MDRPSTCRPILAVPATPQTSSPLMCLPGEIRAKIYRLVLREDCLTDEEHRWLRTEVHTRPGFTGPRRMDCAILQTCRAIYAECWHLPNRLRQPVFRIDPASPRESWSGSTRRFKTPKNGDLYTARRLLHQTLRRMRLMHGIRRQSSAVEWWALDFDDEERCRRDRKFLEIEHAQVFSSVRGLQTHALANILATPDFHPRHLTITIRHVDWQGWKEDLPLQIRGGWLEQLGHSLSPSTQEIVIELESLERKREQVDYIATHISRHWFIKRQDGEILYPDATEGSNTITQWNGSSVLHDTRWIRDESSAMELEYYIVSVPFRERRIHRAGAQISQEARDGIFDVSAMGVEAPGEPLTMTDHAIKTVHWPWGEGDPPPPGEPRPMRYHDFVWGVCGNCRPPPPWRANEHPKWDRW